MISKGTVIMSKGASTKFYEDIGTGLGLYYDMGAHASVVVYTEKDDPVVSSHGILVMAPNFTLAQDEKYTPGQNRIGYIKIKPNDNGEVRDIHVKGSMIIDHYIFLYECMADLLGGWFFGQHSDEWFQPPKEMVIPEKQTELGIVEPGDLVISRGNTSVLFRANGGVVAAGYVTVLLIPVRRAGDEHIRSVVVFQ